MKLNKPAVSALLTFLLISLTVIYIARLDDKRYSQSRRSETLDRVSTLRAKLEAALNSRLFLPKTLIAYVAGHPDITVEEFRSIARELIFQYEGVRSIQLAKNSIVSHVYPLEGNEKALGFKLLENPQQSPAVKRAIDTRNTVVAGPVRLIQGGEGFISRTPIFLPSTEGLPQGGNYWGLSTLIIDKDWLLDNGGLNDKGIDLTFALTGKDGLGSQGDIFFGDESVLRQEPVILGISIPNGSWQIAAIPAKGWGERSPLSIYIWIIGSIISLTAAGLVWSTVSARKELQEERDNLEERVNKRTFELSQINQALNAEISSRIETERELLKSEERLQKIIDGSSAIIFMKDMDGKYLLINSLFERLFHISKKEVIGKTDHDIFPKETADAFREADLKALKAIKPIETEEVVPQDDGDHYYISLKFPLYDRNDRPYAVCGIATDITERKRMTDELIRLDKMDSIGLLAGGIAHDFNNILATMLNTISLARLTKDPDKCTELLFRTEAACSRASAITNQLLTFSKGGKPVKKTVVIEDIINESVNFALSGTNIKPELLLKEDLWPVEADPGQVNQVLSNLIINAHHVMPDGGRLTVTAENRLLDGTNRFLLGPGEYVMISIRDTGTGIAEEHLNKIFDPYFTTKERGSGLGLAICYSIIKNHSGHIWAESATGVGTTFYIYLPASRETKSKKREVASELLPGSGRVLLMDDDEMLRASLIELITTLGYDADGAKNGEEALELYMNARRKGRGYDAVILDLTIPGGLGGKEVIQRLIEIDPDVKAIVSSGYAEGGITADYKEYGFSAVLTKPYTVEQLSNKLNSLLQ